LPSIEDNWLEVEFGYFFGPQLNLAGGAGKLSRPPNRSKVTANWFALQKALFNTFRHFCILPVGPGLVPVNEQLISLDPETVVGAGPSLLNWFLERLKVDLLQNAFKIVVELLREPRREHLLDALVEHFLNFEPFPLEDVQKIHQLVFPLHVAAQQLLILLDLLLELVDRVHFRLWEVKILVEPLLLRFLDHAHQVLNLFVFV
jgi:hypothetical protein